VYGCTVTGGTARPGTDDIFEVDWFTAKEAANLKLMSWMPPVLPDLFTWNVSA
jgi:hypothetical protein